MTQHHKLYYHKLGTSQSQDVLIFGGEKMPRRYIGASITEDQRFLVISAANSTSGNELYIKDLKNPSGKIINIISDMTNEHQVLDAIGNTLYIETNLKAPNNRVVKVDFSNPASNNWVDVIPETENVLSVHTGGGKLFANYLKDATSLIMQYDMNGKLERFIIDQVLSGCQEIIKHILLLQFGPGCVPLLAIFTTST